LGKRISSLPPPADEDSGKECQLPKVQLRAESTYDLIRKMCRWCNRIRKEERLRRTIEKKLARKQERQVRI
jgi:hypothetical protein